MGGVNCEISATIGATAGAFTEADLSDNDFTFFDRLPGRALNSEPLAGCLVIILRATLTLNLCHMSSRGDF